MGTVLEAAPGERLRTLRELLGVTQTELAKQCSISQGWISQVENGTKDPARDTLETIAAVTGTPVGFFDVAPTDVPLDSLRFRKLASASPVTTRRIHAFYSESYRVAETLLDDQGYPVPPLPFVTQDAIDDQDIEDLADATREALRLAPDRPIPHLTRALERGGVAVAPIALPDPAGKEKDSEKSPTTEHYGVSYWAGVNEHALIGYFPGSQGDRDRFTLAHEVGHAVLHTFRPRAADAEQEANRFAGALLMPRRRAESDLTGALTLPQFARLKATWGISMQALIMRGVAVGNISDTRKRSLFVQLSQRGWRKTEPVEVGQEEPLLLWTLLTKRFGPRPYVPGAEALAIHPTVLRSIAPTVASASGPTPSDNASEPAGAAVLQFRTRPGVPAAASGAPCRASN